MSRAAVTRMSENVKTSGLSSMSGRQSVEHSPVASAATTKGQSKLRIRTKSIAVNDTLKNTADNHKSALVAKV